MEPDMARLDFDIEMMPIWVQLFRAHLELYSKLSLSYIASAIEVPLYMDFVTASRDQLEYVKVYIEVGVENMILRRVSVALKDGSVVHIKVVVPWLPSCCSKCIVFGHSNKGCPSEIKKPTQPCKLKEVVTLKEIDESSG
ncbi:hypothetical protein V6N13_099376 [Hibiscus sabdariffa]